MWISNKLVDYKEEHCFLVSLYHNKNITAYNIISKKNKQKTLGKTQNPLNTDPTAQSLLQKYNFVNNGQKLHESRY